MPMHAPGRWQSSMPWPRVWPVAALVIASHAALLQGWQVAKDGTQPTASPVSAMVVRMLTPSPAAPKDPASVAALKPAVEPTPRNTEPVPASPGRLSRSATASARAAASPPAAATTRVARPDSEYVAASRLDPGPKLLEDVDPVYPPEAGLTEGTVVLRLLIGRTGTVDEVTVVRAAPSGIFERAAAAAFAAARFSPGRLLGVPVKSQVTFEVHFTPVDRGANVAAPTY
jgi:TonB family protein